MQTAVISDALVEIGGRMSRLAVAGRSLTSASGEGGAGHWRSDALGQLVAVFLMLCGSDFSKVTGLLSQFSDSRWEMRGRVGHKETLSGIPASSWGEGASFGAFTFCWKGMLLDGSAQASVFLNCPRNQKKLVTSVFWTELTV